MIPFGERGRVFWFCDTSLSRGPLISIVHFFFFPLNHEALGKCDPPPPSYHPPSGNGAHTRWLSLVLWTFQPSLSFLLYLSIRLVFSISTLRMESSFWRWSSSVLMPPDSLLWPDFRCLFPPCVLIEVTSMFHLLVMPEAGLASWACCHAFPHGPVLRRGWVLCSHCLEILNNFILGLCFVSEVGWHAGHASGPRVPHSCVVLPPPFILPPPYLSASLGSVQPPAPGPGLWPLPLSSWAASCLGRWRPVLCPALQTHQGSGCRRGWDQGKGGVAVLVHVFHCHGAISGWLSRNLSSTTDPSARIQCILAQELEFLAGCHSWVIDSDRPLGRRDWYLCSGWSPSFSFCVGPCQLSFEPWL